MKYHEILSLMRKLRRNQTPSEKILWHELRNRKLNGKKFLRQHAIIYQNTNSECYFFIPDFYCSEHKLAVELDGTIHDFQKHHDYNRELILNELGIKVLRIKNEELSDITKVKEKIGAAIS